MAKRRDGLEKGLVGVAGEYLVAAELTRRGYLASLTLRNSRGVDVFVSDPEASRAVGVQVKTNSGSRRKWLLTEKVERYVARNLFYVFVNLHDGARPATYHVVPSTDVAGYAKRRHRRWLRGTKRDGSPRKDTAMRSFRDWDGDYLDAWNLLRLDRGRKRRRSRINRRRE